MNSDEQNILIDYLNSGGSLYIEGADVAEGHQDTDFLDLLGFELFDPGASNEVFSLDGEDGTIAADLSFSYQGGTDAHYSLDKLSVTSGEILFTSENDLTCVVACDNRGYRTIAASPILGAIADGPGNNTKEFLMEVYLDFLDVDYSADGILNGQIVDSQTQEPIGDVSILIENYQTISDDLGNYQIAIPQGLYDIELQHPDYENIFLPDYVQIIAGETTTLDFAMDPNIFSEEYSVPKITELQNNFPNPFNPETTIFFSTSENTENVQIKIYNLTGQKVRTLLDENLLAGWHSVIWDGKDDEGKLVGSGIYFSRMTAGSFVQTKKMMLLK